VIIFNNQKFIQAAFDSEGELESVVVQNTEYLFGPNSIYLPKSLISTHDGFGTIPDGFAIDLAARRWFIVEAELSKHSVWGHIAPQIAKQLVAATNPVTKQMLINLIVAQVHENEELMEKFTEQGIHALDVRSVLGEIFDTKPIIGMPIDSVTKDLEEWANTLKVVVRLWIVRKLVEFGNPESLMYELPEEFKPTLDTDEDEQAESSKKSWYNVTVSDLIEMNLLKTGDKLSMSYKPRNGEKKSYVGIVHDDGGIEVLGKVFSAPSYAALYAMQDAGSKTRTTANGWTLWKKDSGELLSELRAKYLAKNQL